jgi:hypothetical protein
MNADDAMERLLRDAMGAEIPQLSPAFDDRVMRRVRPRRLTTTGRVVMAVYSVVAAAAAVWLVHDLPMNLTLAAVTIGVPVAAGANAYVRRFAAGG